MSSESRRTDVLLVAAHAPELAGMRAHLSDRLIGDIRGLHVRAKIVGIGLAAAGPATARGILAVRPRAVIQLGSCGVYPNQSQYQPHDVLVSSGAKLASHEALQGQSRFPAPMVNQLECDPVLIAGLTSAADRTFAAPIASPLAQTVDDTVAAAMHPGTGCHGESLETFAIGMACRASEVRFCAVLGVSHMVGSTGATDWAQFQRAAVTRAAEVVVTWIQRGAQGLPHG